MNGLAVGLEIARIGEPQPAAFGEFHELLEAGASEGVLAYEIRPFVAIESMQVLEIFVDDHILGANVEINHAKFGFWWCGWEVLAAEIGRAHV